MSDVLEQEKVITTNDGDHDKFQHYFSKKAIDENLMTGKPMTAVCGKVVANQVDPLGRTVCHKCKEIYDSMKD